VSDFLAPPCTGLNMT